MSIKRKKSSKGSGRHLNRKSQYLSHFYQEILCKNGFKSGISNKGTPFDNALVESFLLPLRKNSFMAKIGNLYKA